MVDLLYQDCPYISIENKIKMELKSYVNCVILSLMLQALHC